MIFIGTILPNAWAACSELPSNINTMSFCLAQSRREKIMDNYKLVFKEQREISSIILAVQNFF